MFEYPTKDLIDILYQGACQSDAQSCRYKHRSPMDLDLGNERTTWEDVRAREEVVSLTSTIKPLLCNYCVLGTSWRIS